MKKGQKGKSDKKQQLAEKRKMQIAEAALVLFSKKGYNATTTKELAKKARVSEGTIFRYFKTKKDILLYLVNILDEEEFLVSLLDEISNTNDPREALKNLLKFHYGIVLNNYDLLKTIFYEMQFSKELREKFYKNIISKIIDDVAEIISEIMPDSNADPRTSAQALMGIFFGIIVVRNMAKTNGAFQSEDEVVSKALEILFYGVVGRD